MRFVILTLALAPIAFSSGEDTVKAAPAIPIVHTWGDLVASNPVAFDGIPAGGVLMQQAAAGTKPTFRVRVGIDQSQVSTNGAVLLYCLAEGIDFSASNSEMLGPFQVQVTRHANEALAAEQLAEHAQLNSAADIKYILYAKTVPVAGAGDYVIELREPAKPSAKTKPRVLAQIKLKVSGPGIQAWSPWDDYSDAPNPANDGQASPDMAQVAVGNSEGGVALPKGPEGGLPLKDLPALDWALPKLNLDRPNAKVQLAMKEGTLVVKLEEPLSIIDQPEDQFLTRWWINDKPFVPDPNKAQLMQRAEEAARAILEGDGVHEVHFQLDFHPERLGAKKGDKIGVQLLVCPYGWKFAGLDEAVLDMAARPASDPPPAEFSHPSNRIDFIYSGDPKHPQQE